MRSHRDIAAALAPDRPAEFHDAAAQARRNDRQEQTRHIALQLDAYPRLCGLPVTIERLATNRATAHVRNG